MVAKLTRMVVDRGTSQSCRVCSLVATRVPTVWLAVGLGWLLIAVKPARVVWIMVSKERKCQDR